LCPRNENSTIGQNKKNGYKLQWQKWQNIFPPRSSSRPRFFILLTSLFTNKTKTSKVYPKYWPIKVDLFGQYEY
jgi:hypothetical protein